MMSKIAIYSFENVFFVSRSFFPATTELFLLHACSRSLVNFYFRSFFSGFAPFFSMFISARMCFFMCVLKT